LERGSCPKSQPQGVDNSKSLRPGGVAAGHRPALRPQFEIMRSIKNFSATGLANVLIFVAVITGAAGCAASHGEQKPAVPEVKVAAAPTAPSGAELYAINCNRCHPERSAVERNAAEWQTIMIHMRVRANLPAAQANAILSYLQADSGN
jgi:mono/diheme cytochrome c family protein